MNHREAFAQMAARKDETVELDRAALLIAAEEYPDLSVDHYLDALDDLAGRVRARLYSDAGPRETLARVNQVLFEEEGFRGDSERYYDPRNSYLNEVIDRKTGIPITLSTVYGAIAQRIGVRLSGVGFPGHFLLKHGEGEHEILIDAFHRGRFLDHDDCRRLLRQNFQDKFEFRTELLDRLPTKLVLFRMLNNLKHIYANRQDHTRALAAVDRMLLLVPDAPTEVRDRGILLARSGRPLEGIADLARYLRLSPEAQDREKIETMMEGLRHRIGMAN